MYNCPECNKEMLWSNDERIHNEVVSQYYCKDCKIELNKINEYTVDNYENVVYNKNKLI